MMRTKGSSHLLRGKRTKVLLHSLSFKEVKTGLEDAKSSSQSLL